MVLIKQGSLEPENSKLKWEKQVKSIATRNAACTLLYKTCSEVSLYSKHNSDVNYFHYITITVPSQYYDEDAILLDGDPIHSNAKTTVQSPLCGNFTLVSLEVAPGQHTTPGAGFLLIVYGFTLETSYGYIWPWTWPRWDSLSLFVSSCAVIIPNVL